MAFDQATRNRLSKFVSDTRKLLSDEFAQQMRVKYGLDPATGVVTDIDKLPTMAEGDRQTAQMLRDTLEHYLATAPIRDKRSITTTIDRIVREQAFTVLNRLCAVRMAEARDLVIESIALATKSKGFQLYARLVGSALGETGEAYVCYLFSLFDELSIDLPVLFDRFSPSGRLFPRESVLLDVLGQINHHELQHLWAEDETIGWIYQYFNSDEERKAMRDAKAGGSTAPRNSRELAVRNQFFTPRYVVEFLTDNTLGRIWYEMTQGQTRLVDECKYLVRRPDEVFLSHITSKDQEHPSEGTIAMADLLLSGTEESFPEFNARDPQPMIELAHCVSAYTTMGDRAHDILGNRTLMVRERSVHEPTQVADAVEAAPHVFAGQPGMLKTQHILEVLFMTCRNERHAGDGSVYSESWFVDACNEVRRRVLNSRRDDLSREEVLRQPVFNPYRPVKDPRDIRMLDPACGSMHFGLYAFDLFLHIYEEAWELEERLGDRAFVRSRELNSLHDSYGTREKYILDVPRLIIERNIHGIDIDSRAVQIAGLSLWLRAQKAWHEDGIKPIARPRITRSHIACAEAMPGASDLLEQFIKTHLSQTSERQTIASIVRRVFDAMKLAGEAGSLLKIEEEISSTIAGAKKRWIDGTEAVQLPLFEMDKNERSIVERPLLVAASDDGSFWDEVEERIYAALKHYAEEVTSDGGFQRRLFADDAARGFAFIDVCRKRYDVAVMNPPFGDFASSTKPYAKTHYSDSSEDIDAAFVDRGSGLLQDAGKLGVIANRTELFKGVLCAWRDRIFFKSGTIQTLVDLGYGVLDGAVVEAAAYVVGKGRRPTSSAMFIRALDTEDKQARLASALSNTKYEATKSVFIQDVAFFRRLPGKRVAYWITTEFSRAFTTFLPLEGYYGYARQGLASADNFRFVRLSWEISPRQLRRFNEAVRDSQRHDQIWASFAKGGEYSPYFQDLHLTINWNRDGLEVATFEGSVIRNPTFYFVEALTYSERTASGFSPRALPKGCVFDSKGPIVAAVNPDDLLPLLGFLMSRPAAMFLEFLVAAGDSAVSGTAARQYTQSIVGSVPVPAIEQANWNLIGEYTSHIWKIQCTKDREVETGRFFVVPSLLVNLEAPDLIQAGDAWISRIEAGDSEILQNSLYIENIVRDAFKFDNETCSLIDEEFGTHVKALPASAVNEDDFARLYLLSLEDLINEVSASAGGSRAVTKKSYFADRKLELLSLYFEVNVDVIIEMRRRRKLVSSADHFNAVAETVSYTFGVALGRWDIRYATREQTEPMLPEPFEPLPVCPPGQLQNAEGLPARPKDVPAAYPVLIPWDGILVDDPEHTFDVDRRVHAVLAVLWNDRADAIEQEACKLLGVSSLREWFHKPGGFFADHLGRYSKSRRQAPIYWPLSTDSGTYTLWLYYHQLTNQTLFTAVNEFIDPKLKDVKDSLNALRAKAERSKADETELERLSKLSSELDDFRKELLRIADFWKPNLNDGVQITAAPLWKFFRLKKWRDTLKKTWAELEEGKYDWAHLAISIWPERVVRRAHKDRSIAIAHDLEELLWHEVEIKKSSKTGRVTTKIEWQSRELSEKELDAIVAKVKSGELGTDSAAPKEVANG